MDKGLNENVELIAKMYFVELKSLRDIGKVMGISAMGIQKVLNRHGHDTSKRSLNLSMKCDYCEKEFKKTRARVRKCVNHFCSESCYVNWLKLINEDNFIDRGKQALSRRKMEKIYGPLPEKSVVHHIDGNDFNTSITNLMLLASQGDHIKIHRKSGQPVILFDGSKLKDLYPNLSPEDIESTLLKRV